MTGWGFGYCTGYANPGWAGAGITDRGRRRPWGARGGFGWRNRFYATGQPFWADPETVPTEAPMQTQDRETEIEGLKAQARNVEEMLKQINARIESLSEQKAQKE